MGDTHRNIPKNKYLYFSGFRFSSLELYFIIIIRDTCPHNNIFNLFYYQPIIHISLMLKGKRGYFLNIFKFY